MKNEINVKINIAKNIRYYRKLLKLTQIDLANKLGVSDNNISDWENLKYSPDANAIVKMCSIFGIRLADLYGTDVDSEDKLMSPITAGAKKLYENMKAAGVDVENLTNSDIHRIVQIVKLALNR